MTSIKQLISSFVAITALLGAFAGSATAQTTLPTFDEVTVTIKDAVKCKTCSGRGVKNVRTGDTNHRAHIYVEIKENTYGVPCRACGGKIGKGKKKGSGKRPVKYVYLTPRGSIKGSKSPNGRTTVTVKPAKIKQSKSSTKSKGRTR